jgi:membrane-bound lytic murein transglycosylase D
MKNLKIKPFLLFGSITLILAVAFFIFSFADENDEKKTDKEYQQHISEHYKVYSLPIPHDLEFAGEKIPLEDIDIKERLDKELVINTYYHSQTFFVLKKAHRWFPIIEPILKEEGIPDDFKYLAVIESALDNAVSPAGASGFWQFMKATGLNYDLEINAFVDERYNIEKSTRAACKYLKQSYKYFNNWTLSAASYNMGAGGIQTSLKDQNVSNYYDLYLNQETARYVFRIAAMKAIFESPESYGFNIRPKDFYEPYETNAIEVDTTIGDLTKFAQEKGFNLKIIKLLNPWLRDKSLPNKSRKKYIILLPKSDSNIGKINP